MYPKIVFTFLGDKFELFLKKQITK